MSAKKKCFVLKIAGESYDELKTYPQLNDLIEKYKENNTYTQKNIIKELLPHLEDKQYPQYIKAIQRHIQKSLWEELAKKLWKEKAIECGKKWGKDSYKKRIDEQWEDVVKAQYVENSRLWLIAQWKTPYEPKEKQKIIEMKNEGKTNWEIAECCNTDFHKWAIIRTNDTISNFLAKENQKVKKMNKNLL